MESSRGHGASESYMLKVAALRLFHRAVSSIWFGIGSCYCDAVSRWEGMMGRGDQKVFILFTPTLALPHRRGRELLVWTD